MTLQEFLETLARKGEAFKNDWLESRYKLSEQEGLEMAMHCYPNELSAEEWWENFVAYETDLGS